MDETTMLSELRPDAPRPDRARLAPGRQRLLDAAASGGRVRRLRSDWRMATVGAVAAIAVAAVTASLLVGGGGQDTASAPPPSGEGEVVGNPKDVLLDAAAMVEDDPVPSPGAKQWIYTRTSSYNVSMDGDSSIVVELPPGEEPPAGLSPTQVPGVGRAVTLTGPGPHEIEEWTPFADPAMEKVKDDDDYSAREIFALLGDLPDDQDKVLDKLLTFYPADSETPEQHAFRVLGLVAGQPIAHPKGLAKVYRAMAEIPGIRASWVTDSAGREALAIGLNDDVADAGVSDYLMDPATGLPLGNRSTARQDASAMTSHLNDDGSSSAAVPGATWKKGDVTMEDLVLESALVDKDRQRP
ncbi:CU044_5270 family protein [Streptomyces sp. NBC_01511]|uniref:CU044_5270 family protein n=1 Tax=unclassified Streptomyces TaxID=2593676 RepID=UPI00386A15B1